MPTLEQLKARAAKVEQKKARKPMLESEVEKKVGDYAKSRGCFHRKFKSQNNRSVPDRLFCTPKGQVFFVEFKRPGKEPTPAQADEHDIMRRHRMKVHVIDNIPDGKTLIDDILEIESWG